MNTQSDEQARDYAHASRQQPDGILEAIEHQLERLREERNAYLSSPSAASSAGTKSGQSTEEALQVIADLDRSIARLENIKQWLSEDRQLLAMLDSAISQHVRQMEQRTQRFDIQLALTTTIGGAVLGWLLAAVSSPQDLLRLLGH